MLAQSSQVFRAVAGELTDDVAIVHDLLRMARRAGGDVGRQTIADLLLSLRVSGVTPAQSVPIIVTAIYAWQRQTNDRYSLSAGGGTLVGWRGPGADV